MLRLRQHTSSERCVCVVPTFKTVQTGIWSTARVKYDCWWTLLKEALSWCSFLSKNSLGQVIDAGHAVSHLFAMTLQCIPHTYLLWDRIIHGTSMNGLLQFRVQELNPFRLKLCSCFGLHHVLSVFENWWYIKPSSSAVLTLFWRFALPNPHLLASMGCLPYA